ncbi:FkbM family methyltransferase [Nitrincola sp. A-D6]|uniref:FkbM family methyltransferase n=1 Tax=Nitrincola sp. A-D6 TaxID=1545442 RepID=UPI00069044FF|nr:FkbM family methyltransferase [Nitrincola sp. A-D6]
MLRKNRLDATFHFCTKGSYDRLLADYLQHQYQSFVFVDIGANQGLYSILAGLNVNCQTAIAFEPVARTFALLKSNIAINGMRDYVHPIQAAVSLVSGKAKITKKPGHSGAASLRQLPGWFQPARWFGITETISLLGPEALHPLIPTETDLIIKVDVEGYEKTVFDALIASNILDQAKAVFYEVNPRWTEEKSLETLLRQQGFSDFTRTSDKPCHDVLATR